MEAIREFVYSILVISVSGAAITMLAPENSSVSKHLRFLVGIVVTSALLFPISSAIGKLPTLTRADIEFDISNKEITVYTDTISDQVCKDIESELADMLYERFEVKPTNIDVKSNGKADALKIESVSVCYRSENILLYSDTVNYIRSLFGEGCEVSINYENAEP